MSRYYDNEDDPDTNEDARARDLKYLWECPSCKYRYEDYPHYNEAMPCSDCGVRCVRVGETYGERRW